VTNRKAIRLARNPILAALLLVTFLARALVPAGFMPGPGGLMLCPAYGPPAGALHLAMSHDMSSMDMSGMDMSTMDMSGMAHPSGKPVHGSGAPDHESSSLCPFAAAAAPMATGHAALLSVAAIVDARAVRIPDLPFVPRGTIVPTRLPRGPPSLA